MSSAKENGFGSAIIISFILHILIIGLFIFGVPSFFFKLPDDPKIITFEMLPLSDIVNVKPQTPKQPKIQEVEKAKKVLETKQDKPEVVEKELKKKEPPKEPKPKEPEIEKPKQPEKKEEKKALPVPNKKEEKKPITPKQPEKPKQKPKDEDPLNSLLKTLEESSEGDIVNSNKTAKKTSIDEGNFAKSDRYTEDSPMSITEQLFIKQQIQRNWQQQRFLGISGINEVKIVTFIKLNSKGEIIDAVVVKNYCPPNMSDICQNVAESVLRAIWNSSPIKNLVPNRYNVWKELNVTFTPSANY
jgi:outer membrane biosynthesis protein TonB